LIHVNRSWGPASLHGPAVANPSFVWISLLTVVLLACVLAIPVVSQLFAFVLPPAGLWLGALASVLLSLLWFELVKWLFGQRVRAVHAT
jgi:Ca2+-transporting ATPase